MGRRRRILALHRRYRLVEQERLTRPRRSSPARVLVTRGGGFIGANLVHRTLATRPDVRVTALDALTYAGDEANLDPARDRVELVNATSPTPSWSTGWSPTPTRSCNVAEPVAPGVPQLQSIWSMASRVTSSLTSSMLGTAAFIGVGNLQRPAAHDTLRFSSASSRAKVLLAAGLVLAEVRRRVGVAGSGAELDAGAEAAVLPQIRLERAV